MLCRCVGILGYLKRSCRGQDGPRAGILRGFSNSDDCSAWCGFRRVVRPPIVAAALLEVRGGRRGSNKLTGLNVCAIIAGGTRKRPTVGKHLGHDQAGADSPAAIG